MTIRLRELIKNVRQCKTAAEERKIISKELALIRTSFKEEENQYRKRNVSKLLFIHMMGYPTAFAQMECLRLIVSNAYGEKRMGYLGLMLLLDERQEVLMLVTNSLKNDLNHPNQYVVSLALCSLANISSPSIARDLSSEVIKLLGHSNAYIRKKATLCAIRTVRKVPELLDQFVPKVRPMLVERSHGILITAASLMIELCRTEPETINAFKRSALQLVKILKHLVSSGYAPEHDVNGITDPFLQVKILCLLRMLGKGDPEISDMMNDILAQVATNTDSSRNVGNAILYECVQTIMSIESESGLRVLAVNILGRFLMNRDNNIRYVALNTLTRVVNIDRQAVQRHRATVVECLKDHDSSIRKRALDLTYALVNKSNIKVLVRELLNYLIAADIEFRSEITAQICLLTQRYAPTPKWQIDTTLKVMSLAGHYVQPDTVSNTIQLIQDTPDLQAYAVHKFYLAIMKDITRQALVRTAVWVIGEFGDLLLAGGKNITVDDIFLVLETIIKNPGSDLETRQFTLTAMLKLTDRLESEEVKTRFIKLLEVYKTSLTLELQQRSCEYFSIINTMSDEKREELLEHMPAKEKDDLDYYDDDSAPSTPGQERRSPASSVDEDEARHLNTQKSNPVQTQELLSLTNNTPQPNNNDLLSDILGGSVNQPSSQPTVNQPNSTGGGGLLDLLSTPSSAEPSAPAAYGSSNNTPSTGGSLLDLMGSSNTPQPSNAGSYGSGGLQPSNVGSYGSGGGSIPPMTAFEKGGVKIQFAFMKQPGMPNVTMINATTTNATPVPLNNFAIQVAVPQYMKVQMGSTSGNIVPPNNSGNVVQQLKIANTMLGQQPSVLKLKLDFVVNGRPVSDVVTVSNFPQGI